MLKESTHRWYKTGEVVRGPAVVMEPYPIRGGVYGNSDRIAPGEGEVAILVFMGDERSCAVWAVGPPEVAAIEARSEWDREHARFPQDPDFPKSRARLEEALGPKA